MMLRIISDSISHPALFHWQGPVGEEMLNNWLRDNHLEPPHDLIDLWKTTGGGDFFETETILGPFGDVDVADDVLSVNQYHWLRQMPSELLVFHTGLGGLTAVKEGSGEVVVLAKDKYIERARYSSLDDWYVHSVRLEYGERYGLG